MGKKSIKIANAQGFMGDRQNAAVELIKNARDIDYITFDFLAELSMSILTIQQEKGQPGYAKDFPEIIATLVPFWNEGLNFKVIANSGGFDPEGCARATEEVLKGVNRPLKIAYVTGDNVLDELKIGAYPHLETGDSIDPERFVSANAYLGGDVIKEALELGADIVITGRVADPSLTVGPCLYEFGWGQDNLDTIAQSTIAGHLIECGTQVTGGICTKWLELEDPVHMGFPIAQIFPDGRFHITKPEGTGGIVDIDTVKEQLLYEIGDPDHYISPDAVVSFSYLELEQLRANCVEVRNAKGLPATDTYKVVATYRNGYRAEALLVIFGDQAVRKGRRLGQVVLDRVIAQGHTFDDFVIECLGSGDAAPGPKDFSVPEIVLRVAVKGSYEALQCFSKEIAPLVTSGPQGVSGYTSGRPKIREVFQHYPTLIPKEKVKPQVIILESTHEPH